MALVRPRTSDRVAALTRGTMFAEAECAQCSKPATYKCGRCRVLHYCSRECEAEDSASIWPSHTHADSDDKACRGAPDAAGASSQPAAMGTMAALLKDRHALGYALAWLPPEGIARVVQVSRALRRAAEPLRPGCTSELPAGADGATRTCQHKDYLTKCTHPCCSKVGHLVCRPDKGCFQGTGPSTRRRAAPAEEEADSLADGPCPAAKSTAGCSRTCAASGCGRTLCAQARTSACAMCHKVVCGACRDHADGCADWMIQDIVGPNPAVVGAVAEQVMCCYDCHPPEDRSMTRAVTAAMDMLDDMLGPLAYLNVPVCAFVGM